MSSPTEKMDKPAIPLPQPAEEPTADFAIQTLVPPATEKVVGSILKDEPGHWCKSREEMEEGDEQ